jgi:dihydroxyacetone kinase-like predicted kinase
MPNIKNIIMAAQQAKDISDKTVEVLPTVSVTQAVAALVVLIPIHLLQNW